MSNVCLCKKVTEETIVAAVKNGAHTYEAVKEATGAGSGCCRGGRCKRNIEVLIENNK